MNTLIDEIFDEYRDAILEQSFGRTKTKSKLLKAILECKPKNISDVEALWSNQQGHQLTYNQALTDWENNIKDLFKETP